MMFIYLFFGCKDNKMVRHIVTHQNTNRQIIYEFGLFYCSRDEVLSRLSSEFFPNCFNPKRTNSAAVIGKNYNILLITFTKFSIFATRLRIAGKRRLVKHPQ